MSDTNKGVIHATDDTFEKEVLQADKPVLVDFFAEWCGPCKMIAPHIEKLAEEQDDVKVVKLNVDENQKSAQKFGVMSIPTLVLVKDGEEVHRELGFKDLDGLKEMIKEGLE